MLSLIHLTDKQLNIAFFTAVPIAIITFVGVIWANWND